MIFMHQHRQSKKHNRQLPRLFYRWHRRIGATAALFLIWIVISGWLLNHSQSLHLAQHQIHSPALAHWYNLNYTLPNQAFTSGSHWLINSGDMILLDGKKSGISFSNTLGFTSHEHFMALANTSELILLDDNGKLIDKISGSDLPIKNIQKIGESCSGIAIGNEEIYSTQDGLHWEKCDQPITAAITKTLSNQELAQIEPLLTPEISVEKLLVDLHTGRFFGQMGVYVIDTIGLCLLLLALSGLWLFARVKHKK